MEDTIVSDILLHTQDMMVSVIEGRWDAFVEMQLQQDQMIRHLFSDADRVFLESEKEALFEVKRLNKDMLIAAEACKAEIAAELRKMRQGQSKAKAYQAL